MERAEPFVPRHIKVAIVAFKIPVVDLMVEHAKVHALFIAEPEPFKSCMCGHSRQGIEHQVKDEVHEMRRHGEVDDYSAEIEEVFDGVHRQPRPRSDVSIAVMQRVKSVKRVCVQQPVNPVEIKAFPDGDQEKDCDEPSAVIPP